MSQQPNIVFFMTDQLRRDALGCYGNSLCKTPTSTVSPRLLGWNDATNDMFQWLWLRWNFPEPIAPGEAG